MIRLPRATKLVSFILPAGLLISCGQQTQPANRAPLVQAQSAQGDLDEVHSLVQAVKDNPSVTDPSKAGPPIHVDPYPKSAGAHHSTQMPMNNMTR